MLIQKRKRDLKHEMFNGKKVFQETLLFFNGLIAKLLLTQHKGRS